MMVAATLAGIATLAQGAYAQPRLLANSPVAVNEADLQALYRGASSYW